MTDGLGDGHGRVQVTTGAVGDVDASEDRQAPPPVDHEPSAALALGLGQQVRGDDATAEEEKDCRAKELRPENLAQRDRSRFYGCRKQCCEHCSLFFLRCILAPGHRWSSTANSVPPDPIRPKRVRSHVSVCHLLHVSPN